jgi:hypothetical protein
MRMPRGSRAKNHAIAGERALRGGAVLSPRGDRTNRLFSTKPPFSLGKRGVVRKRQRGSARRIFARLEADANPSQIRNAGKR